MFLKYLIEIRYHNKFVVFVIFIYKNCYNYSINKKFLIENIVEPKSE